MTAMVDLDHGPLGPKQIATAAAQPGPTGLVGSPGPCAYGRNWVTCWKDVTR